MKLIVTTAQFDLLLKQQKPKYPILFDGKIAPIVNDILKQANASKCSK